MNRIFAIALAASAVLFNSCLLQDEDVRVSGVSLDRETLAFTEGDEAVALTASVAPVDAKNKAVSWMSSAPAVASVDDLGKVAPLKAGRATITVTTADGAKTAVCTVTVAAKIPPLSVFEADPNWQLAAMTVGTAIAPFELTGAVRGGTTPYAFSQTGLPAGLSVAVDSDGIYGVIRGTPTAVAPAGTATITVSDSSDPRQSVSFTIRYGAVTEPEIPAVAVTDIAILPTGDVSVGVGATTTLTATVSPEDATVKTVTWSSSAPAVATVDAATGTVTGVAAGAAVITAAANDGSGVRATRSVAVVAPGTPTYTIRVTSGLIPFGNPRTPYTPPAAQTVTVRVTGTGPVTLTQPKAANFEIGQLSATTLVDGNGGADAYASFTVRPKAGLPVGVYDEEITISGTGGAQDVVTARFTVQPPFVYGRPVITIGTQPAASTIVTAGSISGSVSVACSVSTAGNPKLSYQWYGNTAADNTGGEAIAGATGPTFTIPTGLTAGTYYYYVVVNAAGTTLPVGDAVPKTSNVATVTVLPPAVAVAVGAQEGTVTFGAGGTVTFPVTTTRVPDGTYNATVNNLPEGVSAATVTIADDEGTLTLTVGAATPAGTYNTLTLRLDIDGDGNFDEEISAPFTLTVQPKTIAPGTIGGVSAPATGEAIPATPTALTATDEYTASIVSWFTIGADGDGSVGETFAAETIYAAQIELKPTSGNYVFTPSHDGWTVGGGGAYLDITEQSATAGQIVINFSFPATEALPEGGGESGEGSGVDD